MYEGSKDSLKMQRLDRNRYRYKNLLREVFAAWTNSLIL